MRVLVVDDFLTMRRVMRRWLGEIGVDAVDEAADGAAALAALRAGPADVVIADLDMPTMSGFELLSAIKRDRKLAHLPVLLAGAEVTRDDIVRFTQAGAAGYLVKPFTRALLEERLRRVASQASAAAAS